MKAVSFRFRNSLASLIVHDVNAFRYAKVIEYKKSTIVLLTAKYSYRGQKKRAEKDTQQLSVKWAKWRSAEGGEGRHPSFFQITYRNDYLENRALQVGKTAGRGAAVERVLPVTVQFLAGPGRAGRGASTGGAVGSRGGRLRRSRPLWWRGPTAGDSSTAAKRPVRMSRHPRGAAAR